VVTEAPHEPRDARATTVPARLLAAEGKEERETMTFGPVESPDMPKALGPYSPAVRAGDFLFVAGQPGLDPSTGTVPVGGFDAEARQAFTNLRNVIEAAGASLDRVVKTTVFLGRSEDFATMNQLFAEFFPTAPPVRSTPVVALPRGLRISIDAVAFLG
jgi:2-iminobutanoate/2-iminopropanoate deaminase